ncbi:MAG: hypothetical protein AAF830_06300 [Pseudomonadota bacterium]
MDGQQTQETPSLEARLSRFALTVARSSNQAFAAIRSINAEFASGASVPVEEAFRHVLERLGEPDLREPVIPPDEPVGLTARFSALSDDQRIAFALVVIEEFTVDAAARIMGTDEDRAHTLLTSTRDRLFAPTRRTNCD